MMLYRVRYMHKIAPRADDYGPDVALKLTDALDRKRLGAALRAAGALLPGASIASFRVETFGKIVAFPNARGHWHAIILEPR